MKYRMKYLITACIIVASCLQIHAQTTQQNLAKYWLYRDRLRKYFVVVDPSDNFGTNIPFFSNVYKNLITGDGNATMPYYIGMLATEYALLQAYGLDVTETRNELLYALKAIERLDLYAENYYRIVQQNATLTPAIDVFGTDQEHDGCTNQNIIPSKYDCYNNTTYRLNNPVKLHVDYTHDLNGFFVRDDIGTNFKESMISVNPSKYSYLNNYGPVASGFVNGNKRGMPHDESKDVVWNYMINLALVKILVNDDVIQQKVAGIAARMVSYMHAVGKQGDAIWWILNPVTGYNVEAGANVEEACQLLFNQDGYNYGFAEAGEFISGINLHYGRSSNKKHEFEQCLTEPLLYAFLPKRIGHLSLATVGWDNPTFDIELCSPENIDIIFELHRYILHPECVRPPCQPLPIPIPDPIPDPIPMPEPSLLKLDCNVCDKFINSATGLYNEMSNYYDELKNNMENNPCGIYNSFMDELLYNMNHPNANENAMYEHLPLIRYLIVTHQNYLGDDANGLDKIRFEQSTYLEQFYKNLLNEAPICGPKNWGNTPDRVDDWCMENRLTQSAMKTELDEEIDENTHIAKYPGRVKIDNSWYNGTFPGIDYMLLHNLYWLCYAPKQSILISYERTKNADAKIIYADCTIPEGSNVTFTVSEEIVLKPGFTVEKNATFTAAKNSWVYKFTNPSTLINTNNCYSGILPFIKIN